jgi:outer membrane protein assembly factor BamB
MDDQFLYISDNESTIWALDRFNGAIIWKQDKLQLRSLTTPVVYRDYLVVGDFDGYLHWINRHNGEIVARRKVSDESVFVPAVVMDDILYVTDQLGMLIALRGD